MTTTDLSRFGYRELMELQRLITAMASEGLPADFDNDEVTPMFNTNSGYVFLTNSEYQVCMLTDERKLETWYNLPYSGKEGFLTDLYEEFCNSDIEDKEDLEYLQEILEYNNMKKEAEKVHNTILEMIADN